MFTIHGDDIDFDGITVARLVSTKMHTLQDRAREALCAWSDDLCYTQKEQDDATDEAYLNGADEGRKEAIHTAKHMRNALEQLADPEADISLRQDQRAMIGRILDRWDSFAEANT